MNDWPAEISRSLLLWRRVSAVPSFPERKESVSGDFLPKPSKRCRELNLSYVSFDSDLLSEGEPGEKEKGRKRNSQKVLDFYGRVFGGGAKE